MKKAKELKDKTLDELKNLTHERMAELVQLKFRHAMGQLEKTAELKKLRKEVARIKTAAREKELSNAKTDQK